MIEITILGVHCKFTIFWQFCHIVIVGAPFGTASRFISRIYIFSNQEIFFTKIFSVEISSAILDTHFEKREIRKS